MTTSPGVSVTFTPVLNFHQKGGTSWMFAKILKEPFSTNEHTPSPSIQFLQQSTMPKVVGPHEETNEGANKGANKATHEETNNEEANEGANEATHKETNKGANKGANEATDVMLQRSTFSLGRVFVELAGPPPTIMDVVFPSEFDPSTGPPVNFW